MLTPNALLASVHATSAPRAHILAAFEINGSQTTRIRTEERTPVAGGANRLSHRVHLQAASPLCRSPRQTEAVAVVAWPAARRQNAEVRVCFELLWLRSLAPLEYESPQP